MKSNRGKRPRRRKKLLIVVGLVLIAAGTVAWFKHHKSVTNYDSSNSPIAVKGHDLMAEKKPVVTDQVQKAVDSWVATRQPQTWGIYVEDLDNNQKLASHNPDKKLGVASVYKLFLLQPLAEKVPVSTWPTAIVNGHTYDECVDLMFRLSDNACAEAIANKFGWQTLDKKIAAEGYKGTITNASPALGTAADTALVLKRLQHRELGLNDATYKLAFNSLAVPKNPEGIRQGCTGCSNVWNKVGYFAGAINDVAIVEKNGHKYSIVIFSSSSWGQITDLTKVITDAL